MFETKSVSVIIGFIERVSTFTTPTDLAKLDDDLGMEKTKFFNIVDDAERLGLVQIVDGNISLTDLGQKFSNASIPERKVILKERIKYIEPFQTAILILSMDKDKKMDKNQFLEVMKERFYIENPEEMFDLLINWGRYTQLMGYNIDSNEVYLL
ncbi:MAG: AAA-associated domain-containing protein [Thermoplasmata archaeon]